MLCFAKSLQSCLTLCDAMDCSPPGSSLHVDSPGENTGVDCHFLLQRIFPTQESNLGLLHYRQILYWLSYEGSPTLDNNIWLLKYNNNNRKTVLKRHRFGTYHCMLLFPLDLHKYSWSHQDRQKWLELIQALYKQESYAFVIYDLWQKLKKMKILSI